MDLPIMLQLTDDLYVDLSQISAISGMEGTQRTRPKSLIHLRGGQTIPVDGMSPQDIFLKIRFGFEDMENSSLTTEEGRP